MVALIYFFICLIEYKHNQHSNHEYNSKREETEEEKDPPKKKVKTH